MDSLLFWGFVLVALIVVTPFIAVAALRRTTLLKLQVSVLTEETESLRRELDALTGGQPVAEATVQAAALSEVIPLQPEPEVQYEPVPEPDPVSEPEPVIAAAAMPFLADTAAAERKAWRPIFSNGCLTAISWPKSVFCCCLSASPIC